MPGWLGGSSPEGFIDCMQRDEPLPCHQTIDYDNNPHWLVEWMHQKIGNICAGSLIFMANKIQRPHDRNFPTMAPDHETVFSNSVEFVRYHREAPVHSWTEDEQNEGAQLHKHLIAEAAKRMGQPIIDFKDRKPKKRSRRSTKR